jgi:plastocyanin
MLWRKAANTSHWLAIALAVWLIVCASAACGSAPPAPSEDAVITIGPSGVSPTEVRIKAWGRVKFVNSDTEPHTMVSDRIDTHNQCPPVNQIGLLAPGERRITGHAESGAYLRLPRS